MLANMVSSLFANGRIETTVVKAKAAASFAERLITLGKKGELHHRRIAFSRLRSKDAVKTLFDEIAPKFADRQGGYTRIFKLGQRRGDAAETCILMLVDASAAEAPAKKAEAPAKEPEKQEAKAE